MEVHCPVVTPEGAVVAVEWVAAVVEEEDASFRAVDVWVGEVDIYFPLYGGDGPLHETAVEVDVDAEVEEGVEPLLLKSLVGEGEVVAVAVTLGESPGQSDPSFLNVGRDAAKLKRIPGRIANGPAGLFLVLEDHSAKGSDEEEVEDGILFHPAEIPSHPVDIPFHH